MSKVYIADTETTGQLAERKEHEVIELAYAEIVDKEGVGWSLSNIFEQRYQPQLSITYGAMAVHHILPSDLEGKPPSSEAKLPEDCAYLVGHNVDFDWELLGSPNVKRICTLAIARRMWPEDAHSLGACLYRVVAPTHARMLLRSAHSAVSDIEITFLVFKHLLSMKETPWTSWDHIWAWSEDCRLPRIWTFGKYKGKPIGKESPSGHPDDGYHSWCLRQAEMDPYVHKAILRSQAGTLH